MNFLKYRDIKSLHLELTTKCQVSCPMCLRTENISTLNHNEIYIDDFKKWVPSDLISRLHMIMVCGNLGDGVLSRDTVEIFEYCREKNNNIFLLFLTNGAAKNSEFWKRLANSNVSVKFAIDGLADTHELYRIGSNWQTVINNAKIFIEAGGRAVWQMVMFKHNEHQEEACRALSKEMGFYEFVARDTHRFESDQILVHNKEKQYYIEPNKRGKLLSATTQTLTYAKGAPIACQSISKSMIYISSDGTLSPCSWLDCLKVLSEKEQQEYKELFSNIPKLHTHSIEEIMNLSEFKNIYKMTQENPIHECNRHCVVDDIKKVHLLANRRILKK